MSHTCCVWGLETVFVLAKAPRLPEKCSQMLQNQLKECTETSEPQAKKLQPGSRFTKSLIFRCYNLGIRCMLKFTYSYDINTLTLSSE